MPLEVIIHEPTHKTHQAPLLFVHGMWHGAWCWKDNFLPYFASQGFVCYAFSLRGHGQSPVEGSLRQTVIEDYVHDLISVAGRMLPRVPVVIGHSMGGFIVQKYLELFPAPAGVLIAALPPSGVFNATLRVLRKNPLAVLKSTARWDMYPVVEKPDLAKWALFSDAMPDEQARAYHRQLRTESYSAFLDMLLFTRIRTRKVSAPMLVLGAARDRLIGRAQVEQTARAYHTQPAFIDTAHDVMLESGWEKAAETIVVWLGERGL